MTIGHVNQLIHSRVRKAIIQTFFFKFIKLTHMRHLTIRLTNVQNSIRISGLPYQSCLKQVAYLCFDCLILLLVNDSSLLFNWLMMRTNIESGRKPYVDAWHIIMWPGKHIAKLLLEGDELLFGLLRKIRTNLDNP